MQNLCDLKIESIYLYLCYNFLLKGNIVSCLIKIRSSVYFFGFNFLLDRWIYLNYIKGELRFVILIVIQIVFNYLVFGVNFFQVFKFFVIQFCYYNGGIVLGV